MITVTIFNQAFTQAWKAKLNNREYSRFDNGHMVSIGMIIGEDITARTVEKWARSGKAVEVDAEKAKGGPW
jgi:hypothetical protein